MVGNRDRLDRAGPARRLVVLAQAHAEVARWAELPDRGTDRAPERDKARLQAEQADTPVHTLGVADRAGMADTADTATEVWRWRHLTSLRYMADMDHTVSGQREAARAPE